MPPPKKKIKLDKFGLAPDINPRDVFWRVMASYAATKKPGVDLVSLKNEVYALMRVALSAISNQHNAHYGLTPKFIAQYTVMLLIDGGWDSALTEFLVLGADQKDETVDDLAAALKKLIGVEKYTNAIISTLTAMLRGRETSGIALKYIAMIESESLVNILKKELIIVARGDIGENQSNAIKAIAMIKSDSEVKKTIITLLSHWDVEARMTAVEALKDMIDDAEVRDAVEKRIPLESNEKVKAELTKITQHAKAEKKD